MSLVSFRAIMLVVSALALLANALKNIPIFGDTLSEIGSWLAGFSVIIGILDLVAWFFY